MRVCMLASGRSYHATRWANALVAHGLDVSFVTIHEVERPLAPEVQVVSLGSGSKHEYATAAYRLRRELRRIRPDLVHSHYATGYGTLGALSGFRPLIVSLYGTDIFEFASKSTLHRALLGRVLARADAVLATSEAMADRALATYPNRARPQVTPFGVDVGLFRPDGAPRSDDGTLRLGVVKKLERVYGLDVLLDAIAWLRQSAPDLRVQLEIVGEGSLRDELARQADRLGISGIVSFLGPIPNQRVPEFLRSVDLVVVPSRSESFGVAAVEAQACGVPVVASAVGGLPEVLSDGETGVIVPKEDPRALAAAILRLSADPRLRRAMGEAGRRRVCDHYDWNDNVGKMIAIYRRVLGRDA